MGHRIKDLIISMVKDEIMSNHLYDSCRKELVFEKIFIDSYGSFSANVYFRFKPKGRGRKPNTIRFDVTLNRNLEETVKFMFVTFEPKRRQTDG